MDSASTASAGKTKSVYVKKNRYPISIVQLAEVLEIAWRNKTGFDLLTSSVASLSGGYSVSYLITLVDNEAPIGTYSVLQDAETK